MKKPILPLFALSISFVVCVLGSVITFGLIGNSVSRSDLLAHCQMPGNGATLRLFVRRGSSATTSDTYSITYQRPGAVEKGIFSAYSSPFVDDLICEQDQDTLIHDPNKPVTLSLRLIEEELVNKPLRFYKGELRSPEYRDAVSDWQEVDVDPFQP